MSYAGGTRTVDVHVAQLRRKLGRPELDPHGARLRLQGRPPVSPLAAGAAVRSDRARRPALARARPRARRDPDAPRGRAEHAPRRLGAVRPARRARARGARPFSRLRSLQEFLGRQDERVVQVPLDGSSSLLPPDRAAQLRRGVRLDGTLAGRRDAVPLRGAARQREGLHPAPAGELDDLGLAPARRGPHRRRARDRGARRADRVPARPRDLAAGAARRRGDAALASSTSAPPLVPVEGARELALARGELQRGGRRSSRRRARPSGRSCSPSATS